MKSIATFLLSTLTCLTMSLSATAAEKAAIMDHAVVLDSAGRLQPWTSYDTVIRQSMNFIKNCPTHPTRHGDDPWFLVTSKLTKECGFYLNQNNQGSNAFYAVETLRRYYAFTGDDSAFIPVRLLLDRVLLYNTPANWAWANVPRTQDNTPDGAYADDYSEPDKISMVGSACVRFYKLSGETKYLDAAIKIAETLKSHLRAGDAENPPLPFRVELKTGKVLDNYNAFMVAPTVLFDDLVQLGHTQFTAPRDQCWSWVLTYPMKNNRWSGYYEDVNTDHDNSNQQAPMESARFMLNRPELTPNYQELVPALIAYVEGRFGKNKHYGATSICEQDTFMKQMSSHTARYASVVARWSALQKDDALREEARASFALATYSAYSKFSVGEDARNYTGIEYIQPWFSDSYFDYLCHILEGMGELPEMAPTDSDHLIASDSVVHYILYTPGEIEYETFETTGTETLRLTFAPTIEADGELLPSDQWSFGEEHGVSGVLRIHRKGAKSIRIFDARFKK